MRLSKIVALTSFLAVASGCGPVNQTPSCGPSTCAMCCTASGMCVEKSDSRCTSNAPPSTQPPGPAPTLANTFVGTVAGRSLNVQEVFFYPIMNNGKPIGTALMISSETGFCSELRAGRVPNNLTAASLSVFSADQYGTYEAYAGSYTVTSSTNPGAGRWSAASFDTTDAACQVSSSTQGVNGVVTFDTYDRTTKKLATGTFDITWGGGDRTTGKFSATYCDLPNGTPTNRICSQQ